MTETAEYGAEKTLVLSIYGEGGAVLATKTIMLAGGQKAVVGRIADWVDELVVAVNAELKRRRGK